MLRKGGGESIVPTCTFPLPSSSVSSNNSSKGHFGTKYTMVHTDENTAPKNEMHSALKGDDTNATKTVNIVIPSSNSNNSYEDGKASSKRQGDAEEDEHHSTTHHSEEGVATLSVAFMSGVYHTLAHWKVLLVGQALSFCMSAGGAIGSTLHFDCDISAPSFQMMFCYFFMSLHLLPCCSSAAACTQALQDEQQQQPPFTRHYHKSKHPHNNNTHTNNNNNNQQQHNYATRRNSLDGIESVTTAAQYNLFGYPIHLPPWEYLIIAILVVEGNYFTYLAFGYTTFSSITLYDSLSIPTAMIASRYLLLRRYRKPHLTGTVICMIGVLLNMFVDYEEDKKLQGKESSGVPLNDAAKTLLREYPDKALGDFLAIIGGLIYGLTTVLAEMAIKEHGNTVHEYTGVLGLFAFVISAFQSLLLERGEIKKFFIPNNVYPPSKNVCSNAESIILLIGFSIFMYATYVGISYFLMTSEATLLNLSLLTADIWAVIFTVAAQKIIPPLLFWVSLVLVLSGVFVYEMAPSPLTDPILPTDFIITRIICHGDKQHDDEDDDEYFDDPNGTIEAHHPTVHTDASPKDPRLEIL